MTETQAKTKTKKTTKPAEDVIVCWWQGGAASGVCSLAYNNGNGPIRTYKRNRLDARIYLDQPEGWQPPFYRDVKKAVAYMMGTPGLKGMVQVPFDVARKLGFAL